MVTYAAPPSAAELTPADQKAYYEDQGYLVFPQLLSPSELEGLRAALAEVLRESEGLTENTDKFSVTRSDDGSFGFASGELETIARLGLPIATVVIANATFGWIKAGQKSGFAERYFSVDFTPGQRDRARVERAHERAQHAFGLCRRAQVHAHQRRRFAGVLAPRSKWRARIVPRPPSDTPAPARSHRAPGASPGEKLDLVATAAPARPSSVAPATEPTKPWARPAVFAQNLAAQSDAVEVVAPNILSLSHWARLRDCELYAAQPRVNWSTLLRRTFEPERCLVESVGYDSKSVIELMS